MAPFAPQLTKRDPSPLDPVAVAQPKRRVSGQLGDGFDAHDRVVQADGESIDEVGMKGRQRRNRWL